MVKRHLDGVEQISPLLRKFNSCLYQTSLIEGLKELCLHQQQKYRKLAKTLYKQEGLDFFSLHQMNSTFNSSIELL